MRRKNLRAIDMSDIIYEAVATLVTRPVTDDELVEAITSDPDLVAKVLGGGRWVPWCVAHGSAAVKGRSGATWCEYVALRAMGDCVWHRAFIPDDEGGTT